MYNQPLIDIFWYLTNAQEEIQLPHRQLSKLEGHHS